ncbi:MAG TPA: hypothetical protein VHV83_21045 [Armatimonadota bacterium]|nr:hypothetical protein [Armatimonadota bacterium]
MVRHFWLFLTVVLACGLMSCAADVTISKTGDNQQVKATRYEATVAADGCMTNLRIGGVDILKSGISISRGAYFYQDGTLKLSTIEQPTPTSLSAKSDKAAISYAFAEDAITCTLTNATDKPMSFYLVFDTAVSTIANQQGTIVRTPINVNLPTSTWFVAKKTKLTITGGSRVWGPWSGVYPVWEATLAPNETRKAVLTISDPNAGEQAQLAKIAAFPISVKKGNYEAMLDNDGCMTNLRIGGVEFLKAALSDLAESDVGVGCSIVESLSVPS